MQINQHVHALKIPFTITTPAGVVIERFVYVYLIYGTNGICLIDSGVASSEQAIFEYLWATDRKVSDISLIIQTHAHPDHIGASRTIKGRRGVRSPYTPRKGPGSRTCSSRPGKGRYPVSTPLLPGPWP